MASPFTFLNTFERVYTEAKLDEPLLCPWHESERAEILQRARRSIGVEASRIPEVTTRVVTSKAFGSIVVEKLQAETWKGCKTAAHLYLPRAGDSDRLPLVFLCCGHGNGGKQNLGYQTMAWELAQSGAAVLIWDNIGQGERVKMGHRDVLAPFQFGMSLQGLIVMEAMSWLNWAREDDRFDNARMATIGNSGGGLQTLFFGAFCRDQLAAVVSTGYPSSFEFIARKEKDHCHCNLLPGVVGAFEMWQLYGCIAPTPLFLAQGHQDHFFPEDIFVSVSRKVAHVYEQVESGAAFKSQIYPGGHSWDATRMEAILTYLCGVLKLSGSEKGPGGDPGNCYTVWPEDALSTDTLAAHVAGRSDQVAAHLLEIYGPELCTLEDTQLDRVRLHQLMAQYLCFLDPEKANVAADRIQSQQKKSPP